MTNMRDTVFSTDFAEVREFYAELRRAIYPRASQRFPSFYATPISHRDCVIPDSWSDVDPRGRKDWFWVAEYAGYQKIFKRFDIAFKQSNKLVSLAYGVPTAHRTGLKVNIIESTPFKEDKLGEKGFELISFAAQVYAEILGANEIRIMKPTSEKARSHYSDHGYEYVGNERKPSVPDYCVMKLR